MQVPHQVTVSLSPYPDLFLEATLNLILVLAVFWHLAHAFFLVSHSYGIKHKDLNKMRLFLLKTNLYSLHPKISSMHCKFYFYIYMHTQCNSARRYSLAFATITTHYSPKKIV